MKKGILFIVVLLVLGLVATIYRTSQKVESLLRVGVSADNRPYEYFHNGEIVGFDVDLVKAVAERLGKHMEITEMNFSNLIPAVQVGRLDIAISAFTPTPERAKNVDFSDPYMMGQAAMISRRDHPLENVEDLKGKTVAAQLGSFYEVKAKALTVDNLTVKSYNRAPEMIQELKIKVSPRINAIIIGIPEAAEIVKLNPEFMYTELALSDNYAIVLPKGSALREPINKVLQEFRKEGVLETLEHKWDIVGER